MKDFQQGFEKNRYDHLPPVERIVNVISSEICLPILKECGIVHPSIQFEIFTEFLTGIKEKCRKVLSGSLSVASDKTMNRSYREEERLMLCEAVQAEIDKIQEETLMHELNLKGHVQPHVSARLCREVHRSLINDLPALLERYVFPR